MTRNFLLVLELYHFFCNIVGGVVSPVLANILLDKLDKYVEHVLVPQYSRGDQRKVNKEYHNLINRAHRLFKKGRMKEAQQVRQQAQKLPSRDPSDPNFRRLRYCRYADDFLLGFIGPKKEAEEIKQQIRAFLKRELKLELSEEKTLITHARSEAAKFLGYHIRTLQENRKQRTSDEGSRKRSINGRVGLQVPRPVLQGKCERYTRKGKPIHRTELLHENDYTIINTYQLELRGIANYYQLAYNLHTLAQLRWIMEQSLVKTLAAKHDMTVSKVYRKYGTTIDVEGTRYKGLRAEIPREKKDSLVALWGGIPLKWDIQATLRDQVVRSTWGGRSELEKRLLAQTCEQCGATNLTDRIEVHHIRALKDLKKYPGREKPLWVQTMAARKRKTLILCHTCHMDIQHGKPRRRHSSRSKDVNTQ